MAYIWEIERWPKLHWDDLVSPHGKGNLRTMCGD
jgi:hypothetical protein